MSCNPPDYNFRFQWNCRRRAQLNRQFHKLFICTTTKSSSLRCHPSRRQSWWCRGLSALTSIRGRNRGLSGSPASLAFGRSPNEDLRHSIGEFVKVNGFPHPRRTRQHGRVSLMTAVAGDQNKRHFVARELIGHRRRVLSIQVGVQQRPVEMILAYGRESPFEGRYRPDNFAAKVLQHLLDQHGDKEFVLHDENAQTGECVTSCLHGSALGPARRGRFVPWEGQFAVQSFLSIIQYCLTVQLVGRAAFDKLATESAAGRRPHRRTARFDPA